ncbi:hypothetical protein PsAD46_03531 [Pseudovibrio sp. Ad46]|nr:hypothetical protein PsAD46_03531 [Pseudovibrio sp. Ad46]
MSESLFKRPPSFEELRPDPEEQYRAGYQHGAHAVQKLLLSQQKPTIEELNNWINIELQKWRHDKSAEPYAPKFNPLGTANQETVLKRIVDFLRQQHGQKFCDDCLAIKIGITPRQHANHKTRHLAKTSSDFERVKGECSACKKTKLVITTN